MNDNIHFYNFMHKQILVVIALFLGTGPGYILMGFLYSSIFIETLWFLIVVLVSVWGYKLYKRYSFDMTIKEKNRWLLHVRYFMFVYFSLWTVIFLYYISKDNIHLHYIAIATQLGSAVVASTILASQKRLVIITVASLMLPIILYFLAIGQIYSYLLAFFTVVLTIVLLYAAKNTYEYLLKSRFQAYHDYLTGLGNRRYFIEHLASSVKENKDKYTYLLLIDLDYFKTINDTLGHDVGDKLLIEVSQRLTKLSSVHHNIVARLGGDEFCILSDAFDTKELCLAEAEEFSNKILKTIKEAYFIEDSSLHISASIGVSIINNPQLNANDFLKEADIAMYEAKHNGRDDVIIFNDELCRVIEEKLQIERLLHFAIEKNEIFLQYQPQTTCKNKIIGCEVLARWKSAQLGMVSPEVFIAVAESTGYIIELGEYILEESIKTLQRWESMHMNLHQLSVNISMRQLLNKDFTITVKRLFEKYNVADFKTKLIFEITETSTSEDLKRLISIINELKKYNIQFSIDDFGTGYSSLSYIRDIPAYELKIDKSFIAELDDKRQASLVKSIIDISKNLNLRIVAEGVEAQEQKDFLANLECDLYQGYLFSKPLLKEDFEKLMQNN
ncbi:putative bifunctional diguanylate cyclase/phosphodiesterase [Sulfurimonas autotrophica]|uniref:Diguanylate cyclase/phosphodiesterase n=1 Tax=Sulfurimonas autotrophica (strain ATCC BAA-671 / DSM 16294 / JCM 11897 / OK10) TaxID=563040 RepID=E0USG5_SULAO|nr:EAL domain-containing protein [Sulfurimonas autotrophica]ADN09128.1 diguanylate cyclase/phosphodiesterase [Sulfurimonas autotrophica DSM 16294]